MEMKAKISIALIIGITLIAILSMERGQQPKPLLLEPVPKRSNSYSGISKDEESMLVVVKEDDLEPAEDGEPVEEPIEEPKVEPIKVAADGTMTIGWDLLYRYDYKSKKIPKEIQKINGKVVKIPGFIVPLSDDYSKLTEFLLVPDAQSCVHVPPPPPNLIVWVKLKKPLAAEDMPYPGWITGVIRVETTKSKFGDVAYKMVGTKVEQYGE